MKKTLLLSLLLLCAAPLFAQGPLLEPEIVPTFERAQDGTDAKMDFTVPLKTPDGQKAIFGTWSGKPLLIFYFMPTCGHCQHAYPLVEKMAKNYPNLGMIAVASGSSAPDAVEKFRETRNVSVPLFIDSSKKFGDKYGIGSVPMIVLVDAQGRYIRYRSFSEEVQRQVAKELDAWAK